MDARSALQAMNPWWHGDRQEGPVLPVRRDMQLCLMRRLARTGDRRALVLLGPRQVGKTTILRQCIEELLASGAPPNAITYFDASDSRITEPYDLTDLIDSAAPEPEASERYVFIDEIGSASAWDRWLKQAVDREIGRIVATDSSASLLRARGRESGVGRWDEFVLEGLAFREFVRLQGEGRETDDDLLDRLPLGTLVERYLQTGGFPEHAAPRTAVEFGEIRRRLREDIADRAIVRDLARHTNDVDRARALFVYLVEDSGAILSVAKRAKALRAERPTVTGWLSLLEDTCLVSRLRAFHERPSARLKARSRIYAADHGLVAAFAFADGSRTSARVYEAVVFRHLRELARQRQASLSYFRQDSREVDFVLTVGDRRTAIEVTSSKRVRPEKVQRLMDAADAAAARDRFLVYGGPPRPQERDINILSLPTFLQNPAIIIDEPAS